MAKRMSEMQVDLLRALSLGPRGDITDECVVKALARRGYAERFSEQFGHISTRHQWRITEAGRAVVTALGNS